MEIDGETGEAILEVTGEVEEGDITRTARPTLAEVATRMYLSTWISRRIQQRNVQDLYRHPFIPVRMENGKRTFPHKCTGTTHRLRRKSRPLKAISPN
jgi:hypothetical protein